MKAYWGNGGTAPLHGRVQSASGHRPLNPRENNPDTQMNRRLGGPNRRSGRFGRNEKSHAPARNQTFDRQVQSRYYTD